MTFQQRCFLAIRKNGGSASIAFVAGLLAADRERVTVALIGLTRRGWLRRIGLGSYEIARSGEPVDSRGMSIASQANLTAEGRARGAVHLRTKASRKPIIPKPKPKTAIEQAWGFLPRSFPVLQESGDD